MRTVYCNVLVKTQDGLLQTIEDGLRSMGPKFIPLLATRCLYQGVCETESQPDPKANQMSRWPNIYWAPVNWTYVRTILGHQMPLQGGTSDWMSAWCKGWPNVKMTWWSTILGHQMPLLGVVWPNVRLTRRMTGLSRWPYIVLFLATRCLYWGYIWSNVRLTQRMTKCHDYLT